MSDIQQLISAPCIASIQETIHEASGNEVFFLAKPDEQGLVVEVTPLARGNDSAVPALLQVATLGDVIVHNHPSGNLTPSSADLTIASEYGNQGVGFYIIDNNATQVYVVVAAFRREKIQPLISLKMAELISENGAVARMLGNFESRPEQRQMIDVVTRSFNDSKVALIEAGTGTGKSLAYLIPSIHWALENKQRVVISTNTINLQEQLINKDLPLLQRALGTPFRSVLVKGRGNYVCLSKVEMLEKEGEQLIETDEQAELKAILNWSHRTLDGSRSDLNILPRSVVWEKVACESDNCGRIKCTHYNQCFFFNARRQAASADLLVVNHHLLFSDLAIRGETGKYTDTAIMPAYSRIVLDEAHNVEEVATEYFGAQISRIGLIRLLGRFYSLREKEKIRERGILPFLLVKLKSVEKQIPLADYMRIFELVQQRLIPQRDNLAFAVESSFNEIAAFFLDASEALSGSKAELKYRFTEKVRARPAWQASVLATVAQLISEMRDFHRQLIGLEKKLQLLDEEIAGPLFTLMIELKALTDRIEVAASTLGEIFGEPSDDKVRWIEIREGKSGKFITLKQAPLSVAQLLREKVFDRFATVILSSATLTTDHNFEYIRGRLGLTLSLPERLIETILPSSFNYSNQVVLGIPKDIPAPTQTDYGKALTDLVRRSIEISEGRALVLFTSYALLNKISAELQPLLGAANLQVLIQGQAPRHRLLEIFRRDASSVLFATDSFWEGVDVAGEALQNVILTKLPFSVPKDPVIEARVEAMERQGRNSFLEYTVPQAVIKFKQGFGRLIRSREDYGSIMIFDRRILEKSYGRVFLESLPNCQILAGDKETVFARVSAFFQRRRNGKKTFESQ